MEFFSKIPETQKPVVKPLHLIGGKTQRILII